MDGSTVTCFYPDQASQIDAVFRWWPGLLAVLFFGITLFHRQWVIFFFTYWVKLGMVLSGAFSTLWGVNVEDQYCYNYFWDVFPFSISVVTGCLVGLGFWYVILWKRPWQPLMVATGLLLLLMPSIVAVQLKETGTWEVIVSCLLGIAWSGIYMGGVFIVGPLTWSKMRESSIAKIAGFRTDDWSSPAPAALEID